MMEVAGMMQTFGAIAGLLGILWGLWDKRANAVGWLLGGGLALLLAGGALERYLTG